MPGSGVADEVVADHAVGHGLDGDRDAAVGARAVGQRVGAPLRARRRRRRRSGRTGRGRGPAQSRTRPDHQGRGVGGLGVDRHDAAAQVGAGAQRGEEVEEVARARSGVVAASATRTQRRSRQGARALGDVDRSCSCSPAVLGQRRKFLTDERESHASELLFVREQSDGRSADGHRPSLKLTDRPRIALDPRLLDLLRDGSPRGGRRTRSRRSWTRCRRTPARSAGRWARTIEQRRADGAGRLPPAGGARPGRATRRTRCRRRSRAPTRWGGARPAAAGRADALLSAYRVGARVAWRELAATAVQRGRAGRHDGGVRRAGVRLHRRAVRGLRGRARRRAGDHRPGPAAATSTGWLGAAARRPGRRAGGRGRARRLDAAHDADRRACCPRRRCARARRCSTRARCSPPRTSRELPEGEAGGAAGARRRRAGRGPRCCGRSPDARGRRPGAAVAGGARVVRAGRCGRSPCARRGLDVDTEEHLADAGARRRPATRSPTCARGCSRRWPTCARRRRRSSTETLRAWLLHQGRRDDVAARLFVHPQTVRYRMGQLRELYGDRLEDPATVLDLTLALAAEPRPAGA